MTNVIAFKLRRKRASQPMTGPCQLLFFTGVRYMRQEEAVKINSAVILRSGDNVREGAVAGIGLAQSTWWLFRKDLAEGRLMRVLEPYERDAVPISVFYPAKRNVPRKVSVVIDFLIRISGERPA